MSEEISLSISETNVLRAKLGLKLIEDPGPVIKPAPSEPKATNELSIEETNKLRVSIGLKPIPLEDGSSKNNKVDAEVYKDSIGTEILHDTIRKRIDDAKAKAAKKRKLQNVADDVFGTEDQPTDDWLGNLGKPKKKLKELNNKRSKIASQLEEGDLDGLAIDYDADELALLSNNDVLTFKDSDVLDEDEIGGELSNSMLEKRRKLQNELKEKTKADNIKHLGRHYHQHDDEDSTEDNSTSEKILMRNKISGNTINIAKTDHTLVETVKDRKLQLEDLFADISDEVTPSDYSKPKKTMKKLKKSSNSSKRNKALDLASVEVVQLSKEQGVEEDDEVDTELQQMLSRKRAFKQRQSRKNLTEEQLASEISINERLERERELESRHIVPEGLVFDDVSEFFGKLGEVENSSWTAENGHKDENESEVIEKKINGETEESLGNNDQEKDEKREEDDSNVSEVEESGPKFSGLGSTLKYLQSQNIVQRSSKDDQTRAREIREAQREAEILKFNISVEERILREELSQDKQYMNTSKVEREELFQLYLDQRLREKKILPEISHSTGKYSKYRPADKSAAVNKLKNYSPQVKLSYKDDDGNELNTKQAYKVLSHHFHGMGSKNSKQVKKNTPNGPKNRIIH